MLVRSLLNKTFYYIVKQKHTFAMGIIFTSNGSGFKTKIAISH